MTLELGSMLNRLKSFVVCAAILMGGAVAAFVLVRAAARNLASVAAVKAVESATDGTLSLALRSDAIADRLTSAPLREDAILMGILRATPHGMRAIDGEHLTRAQLLVLNGRRLWVSGQRQRAAAEWRKIDVASLLARLAAEDKSQRNFTRAIDEYSQAFAVQPRSADTWSAVGDLYERTKQWELAEDAYRQAMRVDPSDPRPYAALAFSRWRRGLGDSDTERAFQRAIAVAEADGLRRGTDSLAWLYTDLALIYLQTDRAQLALTAGRNAVRQDASIPYAHYFLGEAERLSGDPRSAVAELTRALDLGLRNEWARYSLAMTYLDLHDIRSAEAQLILLRRTEPRFKALSILSDNIQKAKRLQ